MVLMALTSCLNLSSNANPNTDPIPNPKLNERMSGVCLLLDMEYMNYDADKDSNTGIPFTGLLSLTITVTVTLNSCPSL